MVYSKDQKQRINTIKAKYSIIGTETMACKLSMQQVLNAQT